MKKVSKRKEGLRVDFNDLVYTLYADLFRVYGRASKKLFIKTLFSLNGNPGYKYISIMRICAYLRDKKSIHNKILRKIFSRKLMKMQYKFGIEISPATIIGEGLLIYHFGGIVLHKNVIIGKNCTIFQGVTIGNNLFKGMYEVAIIGDNVSIASGAKVIGPVKIGDNVTIGANCVVTSNIPDNVVVGGVPGRIISRKKGIVINTDYKMRDEV